MKLDQYLQTVKRMFLDTAPVIYYVEGHPQYLPLVENIFDKIDTGHMEAVTSPITLAESLIIPYRIANPELQKIFVEVLTGGSHTYFATIGQNAGEQAAQLRAHYNLSLADALQLALAMEMNCDAFLTNDIALKRVTELSIIVLEEWR